MSHSYLYKVFKTKVTEIEEYKNGWGSGPPLWRFMCEEYLNKEFNLMEDNQPLWDLAYDYKVKLAHRHCLFMTYDFCVISIYDLFRFGINCKITHIDIIKNGIATWSHWDEIGDDLMGISVKKIDKRAIGIGLTCTSVSDIWLDYAYEKGKVDKDIMDSRKFFNMESKKFFNKES